MGRDKTYLVYDGVLFASDTPLLKTTNRAFRFGDGLFETIHYYKGVPLFLNDHYERLVRGMSVIRLSLQGFPSRSELHNRIVSLINKNRLFGDIRVRLTVFRKGEGLYTPIDLQASWIIETTPLPEVGFTLNNKGLTTNIFADFPKLVSPVSPFKTIASMPYILAGLHCKEHQLDDCLIVNGQGQIIESISSNLFLIKENTIFTPGIGAGCIDGIIRKQVISFLPALGFRIMETSGFTKSELLNADEIFLTNSIKGLQWVVGIDDVRFFGIKVQKIFKQLTALLPAS